MAYSRAKGVFIGGYVPPELRDYLRGRALSEGKSLSAVLIRIIRASMQTYEPTSSVAAQIERHERKYVRKAS